MPVFNVLSTIALMIFGGEKSSPWRIVKGVLLNPLILGTLAGSVAYIVLYMAKSFVEMYWIEGQAMGAVQVRLAAKLSASCVNAAVALVVATLLAAALRPALRRAKVLAQ